MRRGCDHVALAAHVIVAEDDGLTPADRQVLLAYLFKTVHSAGWRDGHNDGVRAGAGLNAKEIISADYEMRRQRAHLKDEVKRLTKLLEGSKEANGVMSLLSCDTCVREGADACSVHGSLVRQYRERGNHERLVEAARTFIEARRIHYDGVLKAFALCVSGSSDAPTAPDTVRLPAKEKAEKEFFALLPAGASADPVVVAGRALFECFRPGRVISVGYSDDESPGEIARKKKITTDYIAEEHAAWRALCDAVGAQYIAW